MKKPDLIIFNYGGVLSKEQFEPFDLKEVFDYFNGRISEDKTDVYIENVEHQGNRIQLTIKTKQGITQSKRLRPREVAWLLSENISKPFHGVKDMLKQLCDLGISCATINSFTDDNSEFEARVNRLIGGQYFQYILARCDNTPEALLEELLENLWNRYFKNNQDREPLVMWYVSDNIDDVLFAENYGIEPILLMHNTCRYKSHNAKKLKEIDGTITTINDFDDLLKMIL